MKKLFISQPMKDKTDEEILAERQKAIEKAEKQLGEKVELVDSFFQGAPEVKTKGKDQRIVLPWKIAGAAGYSRCSFLLQRMDRVQGL